MKKKIEEEVQEEGKLVSKNGIKCRWMREDRIEMEG